MVVLTALGSCVDIFIEATRKWKLIFIIIFLAFILHIVSISTTAWTISKNNGTTELQGLWYLCNHEDDITCCQTLNDYLVFAENEIPGWIKGCRALQIIGIILGLITLIVTLGCMTKERSRQLKMICIGSNFATAAMENINLIIYGDQYKNAKWMMNHSLYASFYIALSSGILQWTVVLSMVLEIYNEIFREATDWTMLELKEDSDEYIKIKSSLMDTSRDNRITVIKIQRVQNRKLWRQFTNHVKYSTKSSNPTDMTKQLWHGLDSEYVDLILQQGFCRCYDDRYAKEYGPGIYFSVRSSYSTVQNISPPDGLDRHQRLFYCKVYVGKCTTGNGGLQHQPIDEGGQFYDSTVDNDENPTLYVIYREMQAYPEYLVTIKRPEVPPCPICLDASIDCVVKGCGHAFCLPCINEYQDQRNPYCPICRNGIDEIIQIYI